MAAYLIDASPLHSSAQAEPLARLVAQTATTCMPAGFSRNGLDLLLDYANADNLYKRHRSGSNLLVARSRYGPLGLLEFRGPCHLAMVFVRVDKLCRGIGSALLHQAKQRSIASACKRLTVNATPGAVRFYERHGFLASGPLKEQHGLRHLPMAWAVDIL